MSEYLEKLRIITNAIHPFTEEEWNRFSEVWREYKAGRKEQMTVPGQIEKYLYFVVEGVQRVYYFDDQHREATLVFTYAPSFGGVLDAMMLEKPSKYYYETLTPSLFLRASFADIKNLRAEIPGIDTMLSKGLIQALSGILERLVEVQSYSSEDRFRRLLERSPHILQLVPHKYLANYLGIDASNFSKLFNSIRI